jgi:hypothetical protein
MPSMNALMGIYDRDVLLVLCFLVRRVPDFFFFFRYEYTRERERERKREIFAIGAECPQRIFFVIIILN